LDVFNGLDMDALRERPTDAAELAHAISRRVERLQDDGHPSEAFVAVAEVRYLLEPLLGIQHRASDPPADDLFGDERVLINAQRSWRIRGLGRETQARPFDSKAWALNVLGKGYRLSAELALDLHRANARWFWERADGYLHDASKLDPLLPFPYAHRLHLLSDQRIGQHDRARLDQHLRKDMVHLHTKPDPRLYECGFAPTSPTQPSPDRTRFSAASAATDGPAYPLYSMRRLERSLGYQGRLVQRTENGIRKTGAFSFELSDWIGLGWTSVTPP